ncbi:stressosome-associated protein Prli42 [Xylanibacillus composti]|nr:stressosome-associated protein Prli42 [Xylanibacillus composti]
MGRNKLWFRIVIYVMIGSMLFSVLLMLAQVLAVA